MKKHQAAVEFIIILSMIMISLFVVLVVNDDVSTSVEGQHQRAQVESFLDDLGTALEQAYQSGVGTKTTVLVDLPNNVQEVSIQNNTIIITLLQDGVPTHVYRNFDFPISGSFDINEGTQEIPIEITSNGVSFGEEVTQGDTTPPVISNVQPEPGQTITELPFTLSLNTDKNAVCSYGINELPGAVISDNFSTTGGISHWSKLALDNGNYTISIYCEDEHGNNNNKNPYTISYTVNVSDVIPPFLSDIQIYGITNDSAVVSWKTDDYADSLVEYGLWNFQTYEKYDSDMVLNHEIIITGLVENKTYWFDVTSCNAAGLCTTAGTYNFETLPPETPPQIPETPQEDITPPELWFFGANNSYPKVNDSVQFFSYWTDDLELGSWMFSWTPDCANWQNDSWVAFGQGVTGDWANTTKNISEQCANKTISVKFRVNDSAGNTVETVTGMLPVQPIEEPLPPQEPYINVNLIRPEDMGEVYNGTIYFYYNVSSNEEIINCTLFVRDFYGAFNEIDYDTSVELDAEQNMSVEIQYSDYFRWWVTCYSNTMFGNTTERYFYTIIGSFTDTTPPSPTSSIFINDSSVSVGDSINFSVNWSDNIELDSYVFSWTPNCANWQNDSAVYFADGLQNATASSVHTIQAGCKGQYIYFMFFANDTSNNWNDTGLYSIQEASSPFIMKGSPFIMKNGDGSPFVLKKGTQTPIIPPCPPDCGNY
ncbi:fibronectin type III domain-containing protein [Candidatus Woesearchaeota archaeon]|nr:MAG: fibronectin type III domain-containing protein [Candidatus Woesearchaeota archaeon]